MIAVIGGGPGGSVVAARLALLGERVLVLEKQAFPRFQLGESLLPQSLHILDALGVLGRARERFLEKRGAQFHDAATGRSTRFAFATAFDARVEYAFQVPRDELDALLLDRAAELGVEVRYGWTATRALREGDRISGVEALDPGGRAHVLEARFVVDATGRDALFAREARTTARLVGLDNTAVFTHMRGVPREDGERAGDIHIVLFGDGDQTSWFWVIPFKDGRTSVGAVVPRPWMKAHAAPGTSRDEIFARAVAQSPTMQRMLDRAEALWPARAASDYSYSVARPFGAGWLAVGDAAGFIDPIFSSGAHLAMRGAYDAAPAVIAALSGDGAALAAWSARVASGSNLFLDAVRGFYAGRLQTYMFTDNPHTYLRRAITSLLSGDVFDDTRYTRDMRERLAALLGR